MKNTDRRSAHSPTSQAQAPGQGALDEAQALFERMTGEAKRRSELEREEARSRGPLARLLLALTITACLLAAATGLYGIYRFPDAPVRQTGSGYAGKGGTSRSKEDFEAFIIWKQVMFAVFPSVFVLGFAFAITDAMQRRKRAAEQRGD